MNAELITIGDEILIGQIIDTNSAWMGRELSLKGIRVKYISSISDEEGEIVAALEGAMKRADIILMTGGLGPTRDDLTKHTLARFFKSGLVLNQEAFENVTRIFSRFNKPLIDVNRRQAELPENCIPIQNRNGTAPGMWFDHMGKVLVAMPGVPHEMKAMMSEQVLPMLCERFQVDAIIHHSILVGGIGESFLAERLASFEDQLPAHIKLAYLPHLGTVRLRLSAYGPEGKDVQDEIQGFAAAIENLIPEYIVGHGDYSLAEVLLNKMKVGGYTLGLAESCTGGYISHLLTSIAGSSEVFQGSVVAYSNDIKESLIDVNAECIERFGAVSQEVVQAMLIGVLEKTKTDYAIAVTGVAGPGGGSDEKPVGTTWIAVGNKSNIQAQRFSLGNDRLLNIERAAMNALLMLFHLI